MWCTYVHPVSDTRVHYMLVVYHPVTWAIPGIAENVITRAYWVLMDLGGISFQLFSVENVVMFGVLLIMSTLPYPPYRIPPKCEFCK